MTYSAIVLAAGKSTRMKSQISKLLHSILGKPLIEYLLETISPIFDKIYLVVGHQREALLEVLSKKAYYKKIVPVVQEEQLGTGDAVRRVKQHLKEKDTSVILAADVPLLTKNTIEDLLESLTKDLLMSFIAMELEDPAKYGRVKIAENKIKIVEWKDATDKEKEIKLLNSGVYCVRNSFLIKALEKLNKDNKQKEYYLPDIVEMALKEKKDSVKVIRIKNSFEVLGINDRWEFSQVERILMMENIKKFMQNGVTIHNPETVYIEDTVKIEEDVTICGGVHLTGKTTIKTGTKVYAGCHIHDSKIGKNVTLKQYSIIESSEIDEGASVGPFAHLRPESQVGKNVKIGNFVELKKTKIGEGSKASHLTYLGDAEVGKNVNIGCGTITCNYDGINKNKTIIEDDVFIGSDNQLIAPVKVGKGSYTASGSTITNDVPPNSLAIARSRQVNKEGYASKILKNKKGK